MDECLPAEAVFRKERQTMIFRINDCLIDTDAYEVRCGDRVVSIAAGPRPAHHDATLAYAVVQEYDRSSGFPPPDIGAQVRTLRTRERRATYCAGCRSDRQKGPPSALAQLRTARYSGRRS
jgi:hypothetical protein